MYMADERDPLSRMQDGLYSRKTPGDIHPPRSGVGNEMLAKDEHWHSKEAAVLEPIMPKRIPTEQSHSMLTKLFLGAVLFFVAAIGVAGYTFLRGGNTVSADKITMHILGPSLIDGGKEATFEITIENHNAATLTLADLVVDYPDGTRRVDNLSVSLPSERISFGTIRPGQSLKQTVRAALFGAEGSSTPIKATLEYHVEGSNAIFVKEAETAVIIGSSPVAVVVDGPDEIVSGQPLTFTLSVHSNAQVAVKDVTVEGQYPFGFSVSSASPETSGGDSLWRLGNLNPGEDKKITITGMLNGQDNEVRVFRFLVGSESDKTAAHISVPYLSVPHSLSIKRPFIGAELTLNGDGSKTVNITPGATVDGRITWTNNLDTDISDMEIDAKITGQVLDRASVIPSRGFYRSIDSVIVWSKDEDKSFASVAPGATGTLDFSFTPKAQSAGSIVTNPQIDITVSVKAKRVSEGNVPQDITSAFSRSVRVGSALSLSAAAFHTTGPQKNAGSIPAKVNQETTYTIILTAKNPANTISDARAVMTLPAYMRYIGEVLPAGRDVTYDDKSRTILWDIGDVKAGAGYSSAATQVAFKVGLTPSISQVNTAPNLTGSITITGNDRFTGSVVQASVDAPTTLLNESGFTSGMEKVVQ